MQHFDARRKVINPMSIDPLGAGFFADEDCYLFQSQLREELARLPVADPSGIDWFSKLPDDLVITFIMFTNRSGSNLVTDILEQSMLGTGMANEPFLAAVVIENFSKHGYSSIEEYIYRILMHWSINGYCFIKIGWDALFWLTSERLLSRLFARSKFVITRRQNKILQAISYLKALRTGQFFQVTESEFGGVSDGGSPEAFESFIRSKEGVIEVLKLVHYFYIAEGRLLYFNALHRLNALELVYEEMTVNLGSTREELVRHVTNGAVVATLALPYKPRLERQSSISNILQHDFILDMINNSL